MMIGINRQRRLYDNGTSIERWYVYMMMVCLHLYDDWNKSMMDVYMMMVPLFNDGKDVYMMTVINRQRRLYDDGTSK